MSTPSTSLRLDKMDTGSNSGTWGDVTNTNLGTLIEQAIVGNIQIAKVGTGDYTLTNTDYVVNENRNPIIEFTGSPGGAFNVLIPVVSGSFAAQKLWVFKNSTNQSMTVKVSSGTGATVTIPAGSSKWLYCDGAATNSGIYDALGYYFTSTTAAFSPATDNVQALGTTSLMWSDLFLASGGVINFNNGDVTITHSTDALTFAGASNGYSFASTIIAGSGDGTATVTSGTVRAPARTGTDAAGTDITFAAGNGTGTGGSGIIAFQTATVGSSSTTANTLTERMRIAADGGVLFGSATTGGSKGVNTLNAVGYYKNGNDVTVGTVTFIIDGGGATITTGVKGYLTIPFACTINEWTLLADQSGSVVVDIWKDTYANYPPLVADTITASAKPTITTATKGQSSTLTGWTTTIAAGDVLAFNVDSITTCQRVTLSLKVTRS